LNVPHLPADFFEMQLRLPDVAEHKDQYLFASAQQGTLLLEQVGQMPLEPQATLLKMIDEARACKGDDGDRQVRIIATSSQDLAILMEDGKFRKDLFYRLNVIRIDIPPLRSRLEDIPALTDFFTDKFCIE
jgi:DNA-binding NtrC family response regulator